MVAHIHQALEQVREIRQRVLDRQIFQGYSGNARMAGGVLALCGAVLLSQESVPQSNFAHTIGWGSVFGLAFVVNVIALVRWHWSGGRKRKLEDLRPVMDLFGPFVIGAVITAVLIREGLHDLLFGCWMLVFGSMNIASRHSLPRSVWNLGWYYIACGTFYLLFWEQRSFLDPWPMGIVFFVGEIVGGVIFVENRKDFANES